MKRMFGRPGLRAAGTAALLALALLATGLTPQPAIAAPDAVQVSSFASAVISGDAAPGGLVRIDQSFDWVGAIHMNALPAAAVKYYNAYTASVAAGNSAATATAAASAFGTEQFAVSYVRELWGSNFEIAQPATSLGQNSRSIRIPKTTTVGSYDLGTMWVFKSNDRAVGILAYETDLDPIQISPANSNPVDPTPIVTPVADAINTGGFDKASSAWLVAGDGTVVTDATLAKTGTGVGRLGGPSQAGTTSLGRIGSISQTDVLVPNTHAAAALSFEQKTTSTEPNGTGSATIDETDPDAAATTTATATATAADQISVLVTDGDGPHLVAAWTNLDQVATTAGFSTNVIDLTAFRGKTITVTFLETQDYLYPTTVYLDNVSVTGTDSVTPTQFSESGIGMFSGLGGPAHGRNLVGGAAGVLGVTVYAAYTKAAIDFALLSNPYALALTAAVSLGLLIGTHYYDKYYPSVDAGTATDGSATTIQRAKDAAAADLLPPIGITTTAGDTRANPAKSRYLITLYSDKDVRTVTDALVKKYNIALKLVGSTDEIEVIYYYENIGGFAAEMTAATAARIEADSSTKSTVTAIEPDYEISPATEDWQQTPQRTVADKWYLSRIGHRAPQAIPLPTQPGSTFSVLNNGSRMVGTTRTAVTAYVIDSGLNVWSQSAVPNPEFSLANRPQTTRVIDAYSVPEKDTVSPAIAERISGMRDTDGHGTQVTGALAGTTYGVANDVNIVPVKIPLTSNGKYLESSYLAGLQWAYTRIRSNPAERFVLNISNAASREDSADSMEAIIVRGISARGLVTVAAGNEAIEACWQAPGYLGDGDANNGIVTVGSTDNVDAKSGFSNYGPCVSVYAPGSNIPVHGLFGEELASGTSLSAPLVSGAAAQLLANNPELTPPKLKALLLARATPGVIKKLVRLAPIAVLPDDRLLYTGAECSRTDTSRWARPQNASTNTVVRIAQPVNDPACVSPAERTRLSLTVTAMPLEAGASAAQLKGSFQLIHRGSNWLCCRRNLDIIDHRLPVTITIRADGTSDPFLMHFPNTPARADEVWKFIPEWDEDLKLKFTSVKVTVTNPLP